jgi:methyl-accepting chemotaxis protein
MRLGRKIVLAIGSAPPLVGLVGIWTIAGIGRTVEGGLEASAGNRLRAELLQRQVDHLCSAVSTCR